MTRRWSGHRRATRLRPNDRACPRRIGKVPEEAKIMQEEPFVPIAPFENFYELIMRANSLPYGLASYVFTCSLAICEALDVGTVGVNDLLLATAEMPLAALGPVVPAERAAGSAGTTGPNAAKGISAVARSKSFTPTVPTSSASQIASEQVKT